MFNTPWQGITQHLSERDRIAQNSARPAEVMLFFESNGQGEIQHPTMLPFDTTFVEEPNVTYGYRVDEEEGDELVDGQFPRCNGFVYNFRYNTFGHYLGMYVCATVDIPTGSQVPNYRITHYFKVQGIAMKDFPTDELDD